MRAELAWIVGGLGGVLLGYLLVVRSYGDPYLGGVLAVVSAIAVYGALRFPEHLLKSSLSSGDPWLYLVGVLGAIVILVPPMGPVLGDTTELPVVAYFGALWIGGVSAGIALERRQNPPPEDEPPR